MELQAPVAEGVELMLRPMLRTGRFWGRVSNVREACVNLRKGGMMGSHHGFVGASRSGAFSTPPLQTACLHTFWGL